MKTQILCVLGFGIGILAGTTSAIAHERPDKTPAKDCAPLLRSDFEVKLIRDFYPEIFAAKNEIVEYEIVSDAEAKPLILRKMGEETAEFEKTPTVEEMADIMQVAYTIIKKFGLDPAEVERVRLEKLEAKGGFERNVVLKIKRGPALP